MFHWCPTLQQKWKQQEYNTIQILQVSNLNADYYTAPRRISVTKLESAVLWVVTSRSSENPVDSKDHVASIFGVKMEAIYSSEKLVIFRTTTII
jgi:hypothetical protein